MAESNSGQTGNARSSAVVPTPSDRLQEGRDYYLDGRGRFVLTASYLAERGYCCGNGCRHCPYGHRHCPCGQ